MAKEAASVPRTPLGRVLARTRAILFGRPLSIYDDLTERLSVLTGLSIFASDNISSSAYATEEIMRVLVLAGAGALALTLPITVAIVVVLAIVVIYLVLGILFLFLAQREIGHGPVTAPAGRGAASVPPSGAGEA